MQVRTPSEIFCLYFYSSPTNKIIFIRLEYKPKDLFRLEVATNLQLHQKFNCLLYKIAGFQCFQETFFIKMDLSHSHFYKTIEAAEKAIKQYFKEHYFMRLNRPRRITKLLCVMNRPDE